VYPTEVLMDVFHEVDQGRFPSMPGKVNAACPLLMRTHVMKPQIIRAVQDFTQYFHYFTSGMFKSMPPSLWANVCVAGGAVLACLSPPPRNYATLRPVGKAVIQRDPFAHFFTQVC
jgi:hypothetical protein